MFGLLIERTITNFSPLSDAEFTDNAANFLKTDIHSHLLPGIDDGSKSLEESAMLVEELMKMGYQKFITTPHIMSDCYRNTPEIIAERLATLKEFLTKKELNIEIEAAAEYYLDEGFVEKIKKKEKLLTFGKNYILFETGFNNKPLNFFEVIFDLQSNGYQPILAHPERYTYIQQNPKLLETLMQKGVKLQVNLNSLANYYGKPAQKIAQKIIDKGMLSLVGSDCHGTRHIKALKQARQKKHFYRLAELSLENNLL